jgi:vitellogenic carboxypeptidase-like protein
LTGLKGVAIGDGFTHPYAILTQVGEYAYNLGLIDYQERSYVERLILNATYQERTRDYNYMHDTFDAALDLIVELAGGVNIYDITKYK